MNCDKTTNFLWLLIAALFFHNLIVHTPPHRRWSKKSSIDQKRLTAIGPLLNSDSEAVELGWSLRYHKILNFENARSTWLGVPLPLSLTYKRIERFVFCFNRKLFYLSIFHMGHSKLVSLSFFDSETSELMYQTSESRFAVLNRDAPMKMADDPFETEYNEYSYNGERVNVKVTQNKNAVKSTFSNTIGVTIEHEFKAKLLSERFTAQNDYFEVSASTNDRSSWVYSLRSYESACEGFISFLGKYHSLLHSNCVSALAFSRGFYPYKTNWIWASAQGKLADGSHVALNFGSGFGGSDESESAEDFVKTGGVIYKLSPVSLEVDLSDWQKPLKVQTLAQFERVAGTADLLFTPKRRTVAVKNMFLVSWHIEVIFGVFSGLVSGDGKAAIAVENVVGFVEVARLKW